VVRLGAFLRCEADETGGGQLQAGCGLSQVFHADAGQLLSIDCNVRNWSANAANPGGFAHSDVSLDMVVSNGDGSYCERYFFQSPPSAGLGSWVTYTFPAFPIAGDDYGIAISLRVNVMSDGMNGDVASGQIGASFDNVHLVPEPTSLSLLGTAVLGLGGFLFRRRRTGGRADSHGR